MMALSSSMRCFRVGLVPSPERSISGRWPVFASISAAMALKSASLGYKTLIVSTDVAHSLADAFQVPLGNAPRPIGGELLWASELDTAEELERVWGDLRRRIASHSFEPDAERRQEIERIYRLAQAAVER